jgi:hypothetical protein
MSRPAPRVSVCVPSYNHARFLAKSLDSVLAQTFRDFEILIVDDGSTDDSFKIAESYAAKHPSIIQLFTHKNHRNRGVSATVNAAFARVRGEYWMGLPSDDLLQPEKLEQQVKYLDKHTDVGWVYCPASVLDEHDRPRPEFGDFGFDINKTEEPMATLIQGNAIPGMCCLMRTEVSQRVGLHEESLIYSDWHYWIRMLSQAKAGFINRKLVQYRIHGQNTSVGVDPVENAKRCLDVVNACIRDVASGELKLPTVRTNALLHLQQSYFQFCIHHKDEATDALNSAFAIDPSLTDDYRFLVQWLRGRAAALTYLFDENARPNEFLDWLMTKLPDHLTPTFRKRLEAERLAEIAVAKYADDPEATRNLAFRSVLLDPRQVANKDLLAVMIRSLAGKRVMKELKKLKNARSRPTGK